MSSPPNQVTFTANLQPAPACYPSDVNGMLRLIANGGLSGTIPSNAGGGIFVSSIPPASSLTNKVWFKIDAAGRPLGVYMFYNGNWRKLYTNVGYGEVRLYVGSGGVFDGSGLGVVGGDMDGWALCNGNNGTPNMSDTRFAVGGFWNGSNWVASDASVGGNRARGGVNGHRIGGNDLPALHTGAWANTENVTLGGPGAILTVGNPGNSHIGDWPVNETQGSANVPLPMPQYNAMAYIMFIGYA